jgi:hypothetical protein
VGSRLLPLTSPVGDTFEAEDRFLAALRDEIARGGACDEFAEDIAGVFHEFMKSSCCGSAPTMPVQTCTTYPYFTDTYFGYFWAHTEGMDVQGATD